MCTLLISFVPGAAWPLILAANRDEMSTRPWDPPARHWPDQPEVVAGRDRLAGGTWMGLNDHGVVAAILNRWGSLGPDAQKKSRGSLVLRALQAKTASQGAALIAGLNANDYRSFNLVVADRDGAFWLRNSGEGTPIERVEVPPGLHMLTARDLDDPASPRIAKHFRDFQQAPRPDPMTGDWAPWQAIMARPAAPGEPFGAAMCIDDGEGFATLSSSLLALPGETSNKAVWLFSAGPPDKTPYLPLAL